METQYPRAGRKAGPRVSWGEAKNEQSSPSSGMRDEEAGLRKRRPGDRVSLVEADRKDMSRLGRSQELNVCRCL